MGWWFGLVASVLSTPAHGFCGLYVAPVGQGVTNDESRVVVARMSQVRFITHLDELEGQFPVCMEGPTDAPTCSERRQEEKEASVLGIAGLLALTAVFARRRR